MAAGGVEELLTYLARSLVDDEEQVRVERIERADGVVYELHVADSDLGKVIGRGGRIVRSLRILVRASGAKADERRQFEIVG
jgi:predicted RNA-binding protein YlqC (UPF0109 family)